MEQAKVLGLKVDIIKNEAELTALIRQYIESGQPHHIVTANSEMYYRAYRKDPLLAEIINNSDLAVIDAVGIKLALKLCGRHNLKIYPGVELAETLLKNGCRTYILGAKENVLTKLNYPNIVGRQHGYFKESQEVEIIADIKKKRPEVLLVALGVGRQEKWIAKYKNELKIPLMLGVGGAIDILAGTKKRAPVIFRKLYLEWFYRLITEPRRAARQVNLCLFLIAVLKNSFKKREDNKCSV